MKKISILIISALLLIGFTACNEGEDKKPASKETVSTETVGSIENEENAEEKAEDVKKAPVPTEEYVLYKETYTKMGNFAVYEYNDKGLVTKETWNYTNGNTEETTYEYTYDTDGSYSVAEKSSYSGYLKEYDEKGRLVLSQSTVGSSRTMRYTYDDNDNLIREEVLRGDTVQSSREMEYNDKGLLIKEKSLNGNGEVTTTYEYEYDENGREILRHDYNKDGVKEYENILFHWEIEYDEYGRIISEKKIDTERGGAYINNTYEYDENGGMCKKTVSSEKTVYEYRPLSECIR